MKSKYILFLLLSCVLVSPTRAVRSLPSGIQPDSIEGEAIGTFPELKGSGTITFINTGGDARLITVCDTPTETGANSVTCNGIDVTGTFTGGPNGTAIFNTGSGEVKLQLNDGKVFSFSTQGFSMNFTVTDPSIFDDWIEEVGGVDSGARLSDIDGQLEIACPPNLDSWDVMKMGRVIYVDCHLRTGEDSTAVISFSDMTTFTMKSESEIVIDTPPQKDSILTLLAGNIWVNVKQMVKDGTMQVHMSQAVAGIKGTTFVLNETGLESTLKVLGGVVSFQSIKEGDPINVSPGESVIATSTGLSEIATFDTAVEAAKWKEEPDKVEDLLTNKNTNNQMVYYVSGATIILLLVVTLIIFKKRKVIK
jgi:hypothetical protein